MGLVNDNIMHYIMADVWSGDESRESRMMTWHMAFQFDVYIGYTTHLRDII